MGFPFFSSGFTYFAYVLNMNAKTQNIIARLQKGESVISKEGGNSMVPLIYSKQPVTIQAVDTSKLERGDIVYCKVNGRIYTHLVWATRKGEVSIGNRKGHLNGWTSVSNVYGIITEIDGVAVSGAAAKVLSPA